MLSDYQAGIPTANQIAADPSGVWIPEREIDLADLADDLGIAAKSTPDWQDRFLTYASRMPDPWRTRLTLDLLASTPDTRTNARNGQSAGSVKRVRARRH